MSSHNFVQRSYKMPLPHAVMALEEIAEAFLTIDARKQYTTSPFTHSYRTQVNPLMVIDTAGNPAYGEIAHGNTPVFRALMHGAKDLVWRKELHISAPVNIHDFVKKNDTPAVRDVVEGHDVFAYPPVMDLSASYLRGKLTTELHPMHFASHNHAVKNDAAKHQTFNEKLLLFGAYHIMFGAVFTKYEMSAKENAEQLRRRNTFA